jgi:hypothetical protein
MVWYLIIALLSDLNTGIPASDFFNNRGTGYDKYMWFEPSKFFLFGLAGMITGAVLWRLREMPRSARNLILQSSIVCLVATFSFWLTRIPILLILGYGDLSEGLVALALASLLAPLVSLFMLAPLLYPLALGTIGVFWKLYPLQAPAENNREVRHPVWTILQGVSVCGALLFVAGSLFLQLGFMFFPLFMSSHLYPPLPEKTAPAIPPTITQLDRGPTPLRP